VGSVAQGASITLEAVYQLGTGELVDPTTPTVSILDPLGSTVITNAVPTRISLGRYSYVYGVAGDALLGSWIAHWTGVINDVPREGDDTFYVVDAGDINFEGEGITELGPCGAWPVEWCTELTVEQAAVTGSWALAATEILWAASGRRFGQCDITLYPCRRACASERIWWLPEWGGSSGAGWGWPFPALVNGAWVNMACGICGDSCSCTSQDEFILPGFVAAIRSVTVDGEVLSPSAYRLEAHRKVVRLDGGSWPTCQDGTFSVVAVMGETVPTLGRKALGELTYELVLACLDSSACRLDRKVTQLTRQGVQMHFDDIKAITEDGLIGLDFCDDFIRAWNPNKLKEAPSIYSPDVPIARRG
jgi:hypothetical protein